MLERFAQAKRREIMNLMALDAGGRMPAPRSGPRPPFAAALRAAGSGAVVAEYKRASPSRGDINLALGPQDVARAYARGGAAAMSVLTEADHFRGELGFLDACAGAGLPLLRKDFVLHPLQVRHTAATPASALLLIARMVEPRELAHMVALAADLGLETVTEVFDGEDLARARGAGATLIQVNNRDLDTLEISLDVSRRLAGAKMPGETWISASGITRGAQVAELAALGYDAVLVGTFLMEGADPGAALARLIEESKP